MNNIKSSSKLHPPSTMTFKFLGILFCAMFIMHSCCTFKNKHPNSEAQTIPQLDCQIAIENWIKNYALFTETYTPLKFDSLRQSRSFLNGNEILPLRKYRVTHTFELQDTSRNLLMVTLDFELQPDLFIDHVRYKEANKLYLEPRHYPPKFDDWKQLGRPFTKVDTLDWQNKQRVLIYELSVQFFDNRYNDNKSENIGLADSLVNEMNRVYFD